MEGQPFVIPSWMYQYQTIKMHMEGISACSVNNGEEFVETNFDEQVNGFIQSLPDSGHVARAINIFPSGEYLVASILYTEMLPGEKNQYDDLQTKLRAAKSGLTLAGSPLNIKLPS